MVKNQKVFGFTMVVKKIRLTMPIVGFEFRSSPYFTLLKRVMYRCAVLFVSDIVASLCVAWGDRRSLDSL